MKAWAICDTDGGRRDPFPLLRHIYMDKDIAKQAAAYRGFDPQYYPIMQVEVTIKSEE